MVDARTLKTADAYACAHLSEARYAHSLRVAGTARHLAKTHGLDPNEAETAGLLHDVARELKPEELLKRAGEWDIPVDDIEQERPMLLHAPVAAILARQKVGIEDPGILAAIRAHTTGEPGMSPLALVLYLADKIEPERHYSSVKELRKLAKHDLHRAVAAALSASIRHSEQRGRTVHPKSRETLKWLEKVLQDDLAEDD